MSKYQFDAERFCRGNKGRIGKLPDGSDPMERIAARLAEVEAQRDGLKDALEAILDSRKYGNCSVLLGEIRICAREAITQLEAHDGK